MIDPPTILAHLNQEDLQMYRAWRVREDAISVTRGVGYTREEIEAHYRQNIMLWSQFTATYGLPETPYLAVDSTIGIIYDSRGER